MFFSLVILSFFEYFNLLKNRGIPILFAFFILFAFTGLRGDVGTDTSSYLNIFNNLDLYNEQIEIGFVYLNEIVRYFGLNFSFLLLLSALISLILYFYSLYRFLGFGVVLFSFLIIYCDLYLYFNFSGIRQGIALSIALLAGYFSFKKNLFSYLIAVFVATLFHKSAIIILLYWPLFNIDFRKYLNFYSTLLFIFLAFAWFSISKEILYGLSDVVDIKGAGMYFSQSYNELNSNAYLNGLLRRFYPLVIFFIVFRFSSNNEIIKKLLAVYLFGFIFYALNYPILQDVTVRLSSYFLMFECILTPLILLRVKYTFNRILFFVVILFVLVYKLHSYARIEDFHYYLYF
ncbi:EpsG family protein [Pseudoalteromonas phenolica]|uniref:EpsG family protein n=1 Tax=Pseudoalteromonas phenolica TaxID=161398 RepID=UPI001D03CED8|nr:EpsG family protein [Pseudoalteromonas phenolica]